MTATPVVLVMIVRDEAHVITRALDSAAPLVDAVVIADTGSTDDTVAVVRDWAARTGTPTVVERHPWVDFAHNRNAAMDAARALWPTGYALHLDADDEFTHHPDTLDLHADAHTVSIDYDGITYHRPVLTRLDQPWAWVGPVHEVLHLDGATTSHLAGPRLLIHHEGARSRDPKTYIRDAQLLTDHLTTHRDDPRTVYYLAQSYRDAGIDSAALGWYVERTRLTGWDQETWHAHYQAALLQFHDRDCSDPEEARAHLHLAINLLPHRAEAYVARAALDRADGAWTTAALYAAAAIHLPLPPPTDLFVEPAAYGWRAHDELAVACWHTGDHHRGHAAAAAALGLRPDDDRLAANLEHYRGRC